MRAFTTMIADAAISAIVSTRSMRMSFSPTKVDSLGTPEDMAVCKSSNEARITVLDPFIPCQTLASRNSLVNKQTKKEQNSNARENLQPSLTHPKALNQNPSTLNTAALLQTSYNNNCRNLNRCPCKDL